MVTKYVILADSKNGNKFEIPRQLTKINGGCLIERTARLLKENGITDILVTSHDKRFDNLGAIRYEPLYNEYDPIKRTGYWLNAFPIELLNEPVCFLFGDVYYSENAIKKIVETDTNSTLFFCTYENRTDKYIKYHDEPLAYKVVDYELFKKHIEIVKKVKDSGEYWREPIVWELYRSINGQDIGTHQLTKNYIIINDESCDIDCEGDIDKLAKILQQKIKLSIVIPYHETFELTYKLLKELSIQKTDEVEIFLVDDGCEETRFNVFKDINIIHLEKDLGVSYARNVGIKKAVGKYIAFIDSDDQITMDYIDQLLHLIDTRDEDVIYFNWADFNQSTITRHPQNYAVWKAIYRRGICPLFDESWKRKEDVPFQEELKNRRHTEYYFDRVLYIYNSNREGSLWWRTTHKED